MMGDERDTDKRAEVYTVLAKRVLAFDSLPMPLKEDVAKYHAGIKDAGYQVFTLDTHPGLLGAGKFMLWPVDEPFSEQKISVLERHDSDGASSKGFSGGAYPSLPVKDVANVLFPPSQHPMFRFIDLFAGVGGFRIAMQSVEGECVFSSEWDKGAQQTYSLNFGELPWGDIRTIPATCIPDHDVLCAGFPCQPFSLAGVSARTAVNRPNGFHCQTQGTLFFEVMRIVREKRPSILFLENVKNLVSHDHGRTFKIIRENIEAEGYSFNFRVIDASSRVPQKRLRCYMVCVRGGGGFDFPDISGPEIPLRAALGEDVSDQYTLSDRMWAGHQTRTERNLGRGAGFTAFSADLDKPAHTLVARYYKDGKECLVPQEGKNPRMLTPRECARLQGFPERFQLPQSKAVAYKQMGNSVAVPVISEIAQAIAAKLQEEGTKK